MLIRLWQKWFSKPKEPLIEHVIIQEKPSEEPEKLVLSALHHKQAVYIHEERYYASGGGFGPDRWDGHGAITYTNLYPHVREWMDQNVPGYTYMPSSVANFLLEITFVNKSDATKFRVFWT